MTVQIEQHRGALPQWPGLEAAMAKVRAYGAEHGVESLVVLDPQGAEKLFQAGEYGRVDIQDKIDADPKFLEGCFLVHNHPVPTPLSVQDILAASYNGASGIAATTPNNGWSAVMIGKRVTGWETWQAATFQDQLALGGRIMMAAGSTQDDAYICCGHIAMQWALKKGLASTYSYDYEPATVNALEALLHRLVEKSKMSEETLQAVFNVAP